MDGGDVSHLLVGTARRAAGGRFWFACGSKGSLRTVGVAQPSRPARTRRTVASLSQHRNLVFLAQSRFCASIGVRAEFAVAVGREFAARPFFPYRLKTLFLVSLFVQRARERQHGAAVFSKRAR